MWRRLAGRTTPALPRRPDGRRSGRHRRLRRRRGLGRAQQRRRHLPSPRRSCDRQLRLRGRRLAGRTTPALPRRPDGRRPGRHRRLRRRRGLGRAQQRRRHLPASDPWRARRLRLRGRRLAGRTTPALPRRPDRRRPGGHRRLRRRRGLGRAQQRRRHLPSLQARSSTTFGYDGGGWRVERHPRFLADLTGDGRADIVGFGDAGVWVALSNGDGTFQAPRMVVPTSATGWRVAGRTTSAVSCRADG